ncbi:MAG: hypothetical protein WC483_02210 [Candidatus Paceibacterota bacterium]
MSSAQVESPPPPPPQQQWMPSSHPQWMGGAGPTVDQVYAAGAAPRLPTSSAKEGGGGAGTTASSTTSGGWTLGTWIIIGLVLVAVIALVFFVIAMFLAKKKAAAKSAAIGEGGTAGGEEGYTPQRRMPRGGRRVDYEGGEEVNSSRYDREAPPSEGYSDYDRARRRSVPDFTEGRGSTEEVKSEGLGERRVITADRDDEPPRRPKRRVRFEDEEEESGRQSYEQMGVRDLVRSKPSSRRSRTKKMEEEEEDAPADATVETKLMRRGGEGRVLSSQGGGSKFEAPPPVGSSRDFSPRAPPARVRDSPATERASQDLLDGLRE